MKLLPWIYPLTGLIIGWIAWDNNPAYMPLALLIFPAWYYANNRIVAWLTVFLYFASASHGLPIATMTYFQTNFAKASVDWLLGVLLVSIPFFLLFFNNKTTRLIGLFIALILITVPPFGLTCWTHPLACIGICWPGGSWLALAAVFFLIPFFCRWPVLLAVPIISGLLLFHAPPVNPPEWQALDTNFAGTTGQANNFAPVTIKDFKDDFIKQSETINLINRSFNSKKIKFVLLPESSGGTWLAGNNQLWQSRLTFPGTALVGATIPAGEYKDSVILAVSKTGSEPIYRQRQPVPVSMWWPGRENSYLAHWFDNPVVTLQGHRVAFLICYEQFLTWPVLQSLWHKPDLFCATSSVWWAAGTNIPAIQHNIMLSWSRLFSVPLLTATNF